MKRFLTKGKKQTLSLFLMKERTRTQRFLSTFFLLSFFIITAFLFAGCRVVLWGDDVLKSDESSSSGSAIGSIETIGVGAETLSAVLVTGPSPVSFPKGPSDIDTGFVTRRFFMAQTEVTNAQMVEVLQAAWNDSRFSITAPADNLVNTGGVYWGGQLLCHLGAIITWNSTSGFSIPDSTNRNKPVVEITGYGAIMFCNWLTELNDGLGDTTNLVYTVPTTSWTIASTTADFTQSGFRLPLRDEWEFCSRYIGTTAPSGANPLTSEFLSSVDRNTNAQAWTAGYYWTPSNYISGNVTTVSSDPNMDNYAVYQYPVSAGPTETSQVGLKSPNQLGLYDMGGNVWEWCTDPNLSGDYVYRGGAWNSLGSQLLVGNPGSGVGPEITYSSEFLGLRICRSY